MQKKKHHLHIVNADEIVYSAIPVNVINILSVGHLTNFKQWNYNYIRDYYWHLYYNFDSTGSGIICDGTDYPLTSGTMLLIPSFTPYSVYSKGPIRHFFIHFQPKEISFAAAKKPFAIPPDLPLCEKIAEILPKGAESSRVSSMISALVHRALTLLPGSDDRSDETHVFDQRIDEAINYYIQNRGEIIKNSDMARRVGMSIQNFERLFRLQTGMTPRELQRQYQLQWAAEQLRLTRASIDEIARALGYSDRYNFTRIFKAYFGIPPAAYRKRLLY